MASRIYITPQIEKVSPAGTNRLGYWSDNCSVVLLFIGSVTASAFTITTPRNPSMFRIDRDRTRLLPIASPFD
jgi:hypothetical protein